MTCTDSYGGHCPNCGYNKMLLRYGGGNYFQLDACPRCGFAYGCNGIDLALEGDEFWAQAVQVDGEELDRLKLHRNREGMFMWLETFPDNQRDDFNVFQYSKEDVKRIMSKVDDKYVHGKEKVILS